MNIVQLGLDVDGFSQQKKATLNEFIALFDTLSKYDGKVFNPIMGDGLLSFNTSVKETGTLLADFQTKLANLNTSLATNSTSTSNNAKSQTELSLAVNEYKKNADAAAIAAAKLSVATSDQAKETAALKLQLSETSKALLEEAKLNNASVQAKIAAKKATSDLKEEERQRVAALKAEAAMEELATKNKILDDKATKELISDYKILKQALMDQAVAYQNLYLNQGKNAPATKQALADYKATSSIVYDIDKKIKSADGSTKLFGGSLSSAFGQLRTLAYILPGIGLAGLFNLAFEAIGKVVSEMGLFNNSLEEYLNYEIAINKSITEQIGLNEKLYELQQSLNATGSDATTFGRVTGLKEAAGFDPVTIAERRAQKSGKDVIGSETSSSLRGTPPEIMKKDLERRLSLMKDYTSKIEALQSRIDNLSDPNRKQVNRIKDPNLPSGGLGSVRVGINADPKILEKEKEALEAKLKSEDASYKIDSANYQKNLTLNEQFFKDREALQKIYSDEARKLQVETVRSEISVEIDKNQKILADERSTYEQRVSAIRNIEDQNKRLNSINLFNITDNISSTANDKTIAENKYNDDNLKATIKANEQIEKVNIEYYQRRLKAVTETRKAEIDQEAIANERIYKNEENDLNKRIEAYNNYIALRQSMQDLELGKDLQKGASKVGGRTSLTGEEQVQLKRQTETQKVNIQADAEKQIYDIVYQSVQAQLKLIVDTNRLTEEENKKAYAVALTDLNKSFEDHKIKYKDYIQSKKALDAKYKGEGLDVDIADDKIELERLSNFLAKETLLRDEAAKRVESTKQKVDSNSAKGISNLADNRAYDEALGAYKAYSTETINIAKEVQKSKEALDADELARAQRKFDQLAAIEREHAENRRRIEDGLFKLVQTYVDGQAEKQIEALERVRRTRDDSYDNEISAIEKSSLSAKDKAALDIQLSQQKKEYDAATEVQERRIKHDAAIIDRDIALARIVYETEVAVMSALKLGPIVGEGLALERGILGAIAAATVLATPIPSYALGTENHPGGLARTGEDGPEVVIEPYKSPYLVLRENISYLPAGTQVIPMSDSPEFGKKVDNDGWEQTRWLAKQMKKNNQQVNNVFSPTINVDLKTHLWKQQILRDA